MTRIRILIRSIRTTKAVGKRFGQWVIDTARARYDQAWLDYQYEIGLRHHRTKKNKTDNGHTLRDLIAFTAAIVVPMKAFLGKKGHPSRYCRSHVRRVVEVDDPASDVMGAALHPRG